MLSTRQRFLLTCLGYLAFAASPASADMGDGWGGFGNGHGGPGNWNGDDGWSGCGWTTGNDNCDGNGNGDDNDGGSSSNGNSNTGTSQLNFSAGELDRYNRIITIHAVLACLVWVLFIPLGGILIRSGLKTPFLVKIHAALQSISYLIYIVAAAMGIYLVRELSYGSFSLWSDPHTKLGTGILVLALLMPFLGLVHHSMYKKKAAQHRKGGPQPGRTAPGYVHLWLGRVLIVLGMINGGLGIRLASNSPLSNNPKTKIIAYSVGAAIMFVLYFIFVVLGESRRTKERRQNHGNERGVPMVAQEYQPVRALDHDTAVPPSYEESQNSLPMAGMKHAESTARYS